MNSCQLCNWGGDRDPRVYKCSLSSFSSWEPWKWQKHTALQSVLPNIFQIVKPYFSHLDQIKCSYCYYFFLGPSLFCHHDAFPQVQCIFGNISWVTSNNAFKNYYSCYLIWYTASELKWLQHRSKYPLPTPHFSITIIYIRLEKT